LRLIKNKALKNKDTLTILRAHFLLLQNYQAYTLNADSLKSYYKTGLTLAKKYNNNYYLANYKFIWANSLVVKGNYVTALRIFQALEPIIASNNYDFLPHFYDGYARLLYYLKEPKRAFAYLKKEAFIFKEHQQLKNVSGVYNNLGILYKSQKNKDSALYYHKQSLKISTQLKDTLSIIQSYNNIGQTHESLGRQKDALFYYEKSYNIAPEKATESLINNYSKVLIIKKDYNQAVQLLVSILNNSISKRQKKAALEQLVNLYKLTKNYKKALSYQDQLGKVTRSILDETKVKEIERLKIAFESDKKRERITAIKANSSLTKKSNSKKPTLNCHNFSSACASSYYTYFIHKNQNSYSKSQ
jgi:Tetratricopeptide repeat.